MSGDTLTLAVDVGETEIESGVRNNCEACPVALGILQDIGKPGRLAAAVVVGTEVGEVYLTLPDAFTGELDDFEVVDLPIVAQDFIRAFDDCKKVGPISFPLAVPIRFMTPSSQLYSTVLRDKATEATE